MMRIDGTDGRSATNSRVRVGEVSAWLTERSRELIPETMGSMVEGTMGTLKMRDMKMRETR